MTSIVIQGLYYLMQRMLNSVLLHPLYDRRVPAEEANNNELMWSGFEGEKKTASSDLKMTVFKMGFILSLCPLPRLERGGKRHRESIPNEQPRGDAAAPRC